MSQKPHLPIPLILLVTSHTIYWIQNFTLFCHLVSVTATDETEGTSLALQDMN